MYISWIFSFLITIIAILVVVKYIQKVSYWKRFNVELIGIWEFLKEAKNKHWALVVSDHYQQMCVERKPFKVIEGFLMSLVIVQDPEAIKDVMITQFESFPDRGLYANLRDPLSTTMIRVDHDLWKPLRQKCSSMFTPAKIKYTFPTLLKVGDQFVALMREQCAKGIQQMEMLDLCARYNTDITGNLIFGLECNSLRDPHTEFRVQSEKAMYKLLHPCVDLLAVKYPKLMALINFKMFDKCTTEFFTQTVRETMEYREKNNIQRQDLMEVLIQLKNDQGSETDFSLSLELIAAQVFGFFLAGYETSASTMSYALFELSKNREIQDKVRREVMEIMAKNDNKLTYESLREMEFLKQVVLETLRKHPIVPGVSRICRRPCTLSTSSGSLTIQPDTLVLLPIYGVHHNPDYYPEPEVFRPERFTEEAMAKRPPCSYLPFGSGPKACIGELLGKLQVSLGLALLLSQFKFSLSDKMPEELSYDPNSMALLLVIGGIYLKVEEL